MRMRKSEQRRFSLTFDLISFHLFTFYNPLLYSLSTEIEMNEWPSKSKNDTRELDIIIDGSVKSISFKVYKVH